MPPSLTATNRTQTRNSDHDQDSHLPVVCFCTACRLGRRCSRETPAGCRRHRIVAEDHRDGHLAERRLDRVQDRAVEGRLEGMALQQEGRQNLRARRRQGDRNDARFRVHGVHHRAQARTGERVEKEEHKQRSHAARCPGDPRHALRPLRIREEHQKP